MPLESFVDVNHALALFLRQMRGQYDEGYCACFATFVVVAFLNECVELSVLLWCRFGCDVMASVRISREVLHIRLVDGRSAP